MPFGYHCRRRASDCCNLQRGIRNKLFLLYFIDGMFVHKNQAAGGENGSIMVGMFVSLCLASKKPSEREFFVPARTDLGV